MSALLACVSRFGAQFSVPTQHLDDAEAVRTLEHFGAFSRIVLLPKRSTMHAGPIARYRLTISAGTLVQTDRLSHICQVPVGKTRMLQASQR